MTWAGSSNMNGMRLYINDTVDTTPASVTFSGTLLGRPGNPLLSTMESSLVNYYKMGDGDVFPTITYNNDAVHGTMENIASAALEEDVL